MPYQIGLIEKQMNRKEKRKMESKRLKHMLKEGNRVCGKQISAFAGQEHTSSS
jgi:hypothetical protein